MGSTHVRVISPLVRFLNPIFPGKLSSMRPTEFMASLQKGQPVAAYFLRGPDRFLQEECRKAVVNSIPADSRQWCLTELEFAAGQLPRALEGAEQMPMLGGHNFLLISDTDDFKQAVTRMSRHCARIWSVLRHFRRSFFWQMSLTGAGDSSSCSKRNASS